MTDKVNKEKEGEPWYVMCHMNPEWIESMLQMDSRGKLLHSGEKPQPPYNFYIPYLYMPHVVTEQKKGKLSDRHYNPANDENGLRSDLHNFVFIQASAERIREIMNAEWNTRSRLRMYFYRDTNGAVVTIPDAEMLRFIKTLQDYHLKFFLDQPIDDFSVGDKVILQIEPWEGKIAEIRQIKIKNDRISLTVSLNIFNRTKSINFPDIGIGDITFVDKEKGRLLSGNPITNYEEEIIDLLSHRFSQKISDEIAESDRQRLKRLASYSHIYVEDDYEQARFVALKLICAYLSQNVKKRDLYQQQVLDLLHLPSDISPQSSAFTPADAYLMTAMFITTRKAHWRTALKEYRNSHPDCPDIFRRYYAIIKGLKARNNNRGPQVMG